LRKDAKACRAPFGAETDINAENRPAGRKFHVVIIQRRQRRPIPLRFSL
jgi:hypothetical protein